MESRGFGMAWVSVAKHFIAQIHTTEHSALGRETEPTNPGKKAD